MSQHISFEAQSFSRAVAATTACRRLILLVVGMTAIAAQAAQPLSDQELKNRYLVYSAQDNAVIVVVEQPTLAAAPNNPPLPLLSRNLKLIDRENTDNLLLWQERQSLSVGSSLGMQDASRQVLATQPILNFGSESFSSRWGGNLDQIIEVSRISGFALYGVDVELYNISGGIKIQAELF